MNAGMSLLATLLLVPGALAMFDLPGANVAIGNVLAAATTTDPGILACATADVIISSCVNKPGFTNLPDASAAACLCCYQGTYLPPKYSSCSSYIRESAKSYSSEASLNSLVSSFCTKQGTACAASATASATPTTTSRSIPTTSAGVTPLSACNSLDSMLSSCARATPGFTTLGDKTAASCICYNSDDTYTGTRFDSWASSCASWAKTSMTSAYSGLSPLASFCDRYAPTSPRAAGTTTTSSRGSSTTGGSGGSGGSGGGGVGSGAGTDAPVVTTTVTPGVTPGVQTTTRPAAAGRVMVGEWGAWVVGLLAGVGAIVMV